MYVIITPLHSMCINAFEVNLLLLDDVCSAQKHVCWGISVSVKPDTLMLESS